jgi:hypothetical protein
MSFRSFIPLEARVRIVLTVLIVLLSTAAAQAQRLKVAVAGKPLVLGKGVSVNPDCSSAGDFVIRVTSPPSHGSVSIRRAGVYPSFRASNRRSACNQRRVPGVTAVYVARRGYTGPDTVGLEYIGPSGSYRESTYNILVR